MADSNLTLVEAAKLEPESAATGYIGIYANSYQTNYIAPVLSSGRTFAWNVEDDLPYTGSTGSRAIDADFDTSTADFKPYESEVKLYGGKIKCDEYFRDLMPDSVARQESTQVKAFARKQFIDTFEGTGTNDLRGIRDWLGKDESTRPTASLTPGYENQVVNAGSTASGDLLTIDMMDQILSLVDVIPGQTAIYCNDILTRRFMKLSRGMTDGTTYNLQFDPNEFGRFDGIYRGIPIVTAKDGKNANLLSVTEYDVTSVQATLSLYIVTWGPEHAAYFSPNPAGVAGVPLPQVTGPLSDGTNYTFKRFKHYVGFVPQVPRCVVRLRGIKNAVA